MIMSPLARLASAPRSVPAPESAGLVTTIVRPAEGEIPRPLGPAFRTAGKSGRDGRILGLEVETLRCTAPESIAIGDTEDVCSVMSRPASVDATTSRSPAKDQLLGEAGQRDALDWNRSRRITDVDYRDAGRADCDVSLLIADDDAHSGARQRCDRQGRVAPDRSHRAHTTEGTESR